MANQWGGGGAREHYKWAFNDAIDPWESERKEMTVIKHLNFPMSDSVTFICPPSSAPPVSSCWKKIPLRSSCYPPCFPLPVPAPRALCAKNKEGCPASDVRSAEGSLWYLGVIFPRPKCLLSINLLPGNKIAKRAGTIDRVQKLILIRMQRRLLWWGLKFEFVRTIHNKNTEM